MGIDGRMKRERIDSPWMEWKSRISRKCYYFERRRHRLENSSLFLSIRIHLVSILVLNTRYSRDKDASRRKKERKEKSKRKEKYAGRKRALDRTNDRSVRL